MTTKSLKETLAAAGYVRLPTLYVPVEDAEMIHYIAGKHAAAVREIKKAWCAQKMPTEELRKLLDAGVSYGKIAAHYHTQPQSVADRARNLGYPPRKAGYRETLNVEDVLGTVCDDH